MEKYLVSPNLSKSEFITECFKVDSDSKTIDFFWNMYLSLHESLLPDIDSSDNVLVLIKNGLAWYNLYKEIGHPEEWCKKALDWCELLKIEQTFENVADCLCKIYWEERADPSSQAEAELDRHCDYISRKYGKSPIYMRFFRDWYKNDPDGSQYLERYEEMEKRYNEAIGKGKDDDFAYFYAEQDGDDSFAWRLTEERERLIREGWDENFIEVYLHEYQSRFEEDGSEREHPKIPAVWEEKVIAYMKGWDYARKNGLGYDFIDTYTNVYFNARHPNNYSAIPWERFDEYVLDIAIRRHNGESVQTEPDDPEFWKSLLEEKSRQSKHRKSRDQEIIEETLEMMCPNGMDED